jgi:inner membrane protein involved in colicin E2 resistance
VTIPAIGIYGGELKEMNLMFKASMTTSWLSSVINCTSFIIRCQLFSEYSPRQVSCSRLDVASVITSMDDYNALTSVLYYNISFVSLEIMKQKRTNPSVLLLRYAYISILLLLFLLSNLSLSELPLSVLSVLSQLCNNNFYYYCFHSYTNSTT